MIRNATSDDGDAIAWVHLQARKAAMPWLPVVHSAEDTLRYFNEVVLPKETVTVFTEGSEVVGFIAVAEGWVSHLYVGPAVWRRGIGSRLLLRHRDASGDLQLWTFQQNAASRSFYKAHGFREVELTDGQDNDEKTPDVRLIWHRDS